MIPRIAVFMAAGTNCHEETTRAVERAGMQAEIVLWTALAQDRDMLMDYSGLVLPGGFSGGDHFGAGRAFGLMIKEQIQCFADTGRPIIGICNGFQLLMEAGLFDDGETSGGALIHNESGRFENGWAELLALRGSPWTEGIEGQILRMPYAHGEGRWRIPDKNPSHLQITFVYSVDGKPTTAYRANPNGTKGGITGLAKGLVMGMMPHPERACDPDLGSTDGRLVFDALARLARAV